MGLTKTAACTMVALGIVALVASVIYVSSILAFIGLGLTFWGAILLYVHPEGYTQRALLDAIVVPSLKTLDQLTRELDYNGKAVYLPPKYFKDPDSNKIYISRHTGADLPRPEEILRQEKQLFVKNPHGILLPAPGAELTRLFEKRLGTSFTETDLQHLKENLPRLFIEDLEIAEDLQIETKHGAITRINVTITNSILKDQWNENEDLARICGTIGCPICSAIACALTKTTGEPVMIEEIRSSQDGKIIEATYRTASPIEFQERPVIAPTISPAPLASLFITVLGSLILGFVGWVTWHDITTWGKDLGLIFFGSRTREAISLGIDLRLIHYFLIGSALLLIGLIMRLRRK
jgi:hypothetical protein